MGLPAKPGQIRFREALQDGDRNVQRCIYAAWRQMIDAGLSLVSKALLKHAMMKIRKSTMSVLLIFSVLLLSACGGGGGGGGSGDGGGSSDSSAGGGSGGGSSSDSNGGRSSSTGGSSAPAANVPPSAAIGAPNSANERTSAQISGTGSSDSDGSIAAYRWSVDNPDNIDVSIENPTQANTRLILGEIETAAAITLRLKVTDNADATASAQTTIRIIEIDAAALPPEPDAEAGRQTVQGIDTNGNGVRDDMEHSLYRLYPLDTPRREMLLIGAQAVQMQLLAASDNNPDAGDAASQRSAEFVACALASDIDIRALQKDIAIVDFFALNTEARRQAYLAYEASRAGTVQRAIDPNSANCSL